MDRTQLVVASNRGPLRFARSETGLTVGRGGGGLISGLQVALRDADAVWLSAASGELEVEALHAGLWKLDGLSLAGVEIDPETYELAYNSVSNEMFWFLFHGLFNAPYEPNFDARFSRALEGFRRYNHAFATAIASLAADGATVLINDYHLLLAPGILRSIRSDLTISYFLHTPVPYPSEFEVLPDSLRTEILDSLATCDRIGLHAVQWKANLTSIAASAGVSLPEIVVAPLASDLSSLTEEVGTPEVAKWRRWIREEFPSLPLIVRIDRMELSKNLIRGFLAIEEMMVNHPETVQGFNFLALCYPSREGVEAYATYKSEVEEVVDRINARFSTAQWSPIRLELEDNYPRSLAALMEYDLLLVNPVRDGLNLVAQEGGALNERGGTVLLSEKAGLYEHTRDIFVRIEPFNVSQTAEAIYTRVAKGRMEGGERPITPIGRAFVERNTPRHWLELAIGR